MFDIIKKLLVFAVGFYFILFFARTFLGGVSATGFAKDITGALGEFRKLGQMGSTTNRGFTYSDNNFTDTQNGNQGLQTTSSKGSSGAVVLSNLSNGNMVSPGQNIIGNMRADWFYEGVATARFLDERGQQLGMTQVVAESNTNVRTQVPFNVVARFNQGYAQSGYLVIEKANTTGDKTKDAWVTVAVTYPIAGNRAYSETATSTRPSINSNNTNTANGQNSNFNGNTLPAPR